MKHLFIILLLTSFYACSDRQGKDITKVHNDTVSIVPSDPIKQTTSQDTYTIPTKYFINIVKSLDSLNFIPDTIRVKKVGYYWDVIKNNPIFMIKNIPFYKMDNETNPIFCVINNSSKTAFKNNYISDSIKNSILEKRVFHKVKHITGFYFRDEDSPSLNFGELTTDGYIEEWEFENSQDAETAEETLTEGNMYFIIYFNSFTHVFRRENYLYTFYSRADWDAKRLEKVYKEILKK